MSICSDFQHPDSQVMSDSSVIRHAEENTENTSFSLFKKESKFLKKISWS